MKVRWKSSARAKCINKTIEAMSRLHAIVLLSAHNTHMLYYIHIYMSYMLVFAVHHKFMPMFASSARLENFLPRVDMRGTL